MSLRPRPPRTLPAVTSPSAPAAVVRDVAARVGLVGNPSDGYGGAVLATTVPGLSATVTATVADHVSFSGPGATTGWASAQAWWDHACDTGHGDDQRIISASLWVLVEHLHQHRGRLVNEGGVELEWSTGIPRSVGLAGSSALAVGVIDAAARAWGIDLDRRVVAGLALMAERDVLGIAAGWQDRIVQSFGCTVLVDASRLEVVDGVRVPLVSVMSSPTVEPMPLLVAWSDDAASPSDDYHAPLRLTGTALVPPMADLADLARRATAALEAGDLAGVAAAMDAGWLIRQRCAPLRPDHADLVELVRAEGLAATTPGSGGSVVAVCMNEVAAERAVAAVERAGCRFARIGAG
jgi:glucuronokinase